MSSAINWTKKLEKVSRGHVSSMTGGCNCPIYYAGVVSVENGGRIIRYQLAERIKTVSLAGNPNPALPQVCFKLHYSGYHLLTQMYLSDTGELLVLKKEV